MVVEILIATISGVLAALIIQWIRASNIGSLKKIRVFELQSGQFNSDFYSYFTQQIEKAKNEIIVTGEGFEYKGKDGPRIADSYHASMIKALNSSVDITRIQTARPLNSKWAEKLKECVREFSNNFHLYIIENNEYQDIAREIKGVGDN